MYRVYGTSVVYTVECIYGVESSFAVYTVGNILLYVAFMHCTSIYVACVRCIWHICCVYIMCGVCVMCIWRVCGLYTLACAIYKVYVWRIIYHTSSVYDQGWEFAHQLFDSFL